MPHSPWTAVCTVSGCDQIAIVVVRHSFSRPIPSVGILYLQIPAGIYMCTLEPRLISDGRLPFPYSIREGLPVTQVEPGLGAAGAPSRVFGRLVNVQVLQERRGISAAHGSARAPARASKLVCRNWRRRASNAHQSNRLTVPRTVTQLASR